MNRFVENFRKGNPEIYLFIKKKKQNKILKIIASELIILALGIGSKISFEKLDNEAFLMMIPFLLIPPFVIKPRKLIFDKMWQGKIDRIEYFSGMVNNDITVRSMALTRFQNITLHIIDDEGEDHQVTLDKKYEKCYSVGDRVIHLPGLTYPANIDAKSNERRVCVCCGTIMPHIDEECIGCGKPFFES